MILDPTSPFAAAIAWGIPLLPFVEPLVSTYRLKL
jgi:hypothetical protein